MPDPIDTLKPGQNLRVTVTRTPRRDAHVDTIERLMRQDPDIKRGLRKSQRRRRQNMVIYNRGNRDWYKRERCGKQVSVEAGATWTMPFSAQLAPDMRSVQEFLRVEAV